MIENCDWQYEGDGSDGRKIFRCRRDGCRNRMYADTGGECFANCKSRKQTTYILDTLPTGNHLWACRTCNWTEEAPADDPPIHACGQPTVQRLGDKIESALTSLGVTKERWQEAKASIGLPPTCNCEARRNYLNALDERLQLGEKLTAFKAMFGWKDK